jgi:hypothetical protein
VPGVRGLAVLGGAPATLDPVGWPVDVVVVDARDRTAGADVVVARADARLRSPAAAGAALVVAAGPLAPGRARRRLDERPAAWLPWSDRVAAAAVRGRVPADLPGTFLRALRPLAPAGSPQGGRSFSPRRRRPTVASRWSRR